MEVFRICKETFASGLYASGASNRWNKRDQFVIYTGSSRSLATLELIVHKSSIAPLTSYKVMVISIADDDHLIRQTLISSLPVAWRSLSAYSTLQLIGGDWYDSNETLILKVPSAVIPYEYNFIINMRHPDFNDKVKLVRIENYFWDNRLLF